MIAMASDQGVLRRVKKKTEEVPVRSSMKPASSLTKEQKAVATWLRKNLSTKKTKFLHAHDVWFFIGSKAVDILLDESPWSKEQKKQKDLKEGDLIFETREQCTQFLDELLKHKMFHRAKKIPVSDTAKPSKKRTKKDEPKTTDADEESKDDPQKKKKRKIRLDMHLEQVFLDSQDAYVWLYDPIPIHYWVVGGFIVVGVIAVCLFPLWPPKIRLGVHYISLAAAGFLGFVVSLALFKYILFGLLWALSAGKLKFWLLPNLTEDVGFIESFWPLYDYTYEEILVSRSNSDKDTDADEADHSESEESASKKDFVMLDN